MLRWSGRFAHWQCHPLRGPRPRACASRTGAGWQPDHLQRACRDLKDILSQQSKVLFVDEPRMVRAAVVHFASAHDRDQARAVFRNTNILGSAVDLVPVRLFPAERPAKAQA